MSKSTDNFKKVVLAEMERRANEDPLFAEKMKKEGKNIDDCVTYILNTVQKSGCSGFTDDEIFGMAVHYFDEEKIDIGKSIDCKVVVNHQVQLTPEEIEAEKQKAKDEIFRQERERLTKKPEVKKPTPAPQPKEAQKKQETPTLTLF